ncbi:hypothetical protein BGX21_000083 [Mortierella sp. AD011]|nr:hypothetical protein BGX20_007841 [Mortierella sp. AD010]KAF9389520.1 hypothetical protein BGX21_000083 [Mortierella sp. AD011]
MIGSTRTTSAKIVKAALTAIRPTRSVHSTRPVRLPCTNSASIVTRGVPITFSASQTTRQYSAAAPSPREALRNIPLVAVALILGGVTITAAGLWQFYTSGVNRFPEAIRNDLRKALYYQNYGDDREKAVGYYRSALNAAIHHPDLKVDGPEVTGIMIQLGTMFHDMGRTQEAIDVLVMAFECLVHGRTMGMGNDSAEGVLSGEEQDQDRNGDLGQQQQPEPEHQHGPRVMDGPTRLKTIGIAQKLGDLYHSIRKDEQAERYYLWSVEQLMRDHENLQSGAGGNPEEERLLFAREQEAMKKQFDFDKLPSWMTKTDLGASLEALGGFYTSKGIYRNALPLYMRALSLVDAKSCHAAVLMCNISDAFAALGNIEDATGWAERGLKVGSAQSGQECDEGCGVLLYNLGMLHEMKGDILKAQEYYNQSRQHGLKTGFNQCIVESNKALKRIKDGDEGIKS